MKLPACSSVIAKRENVYQYLLRLLFLALCFLLTASSSYPAFASQRVASIPEANSLQAQSILFHEDFNDGLAQGFGNENGSWKIIDGKYTATTGQSRFSTTGDANWQNYTLEADYINAQDGGLLVRTQDYNNCISLVIRPTYNDVGWNIRKNGAWGAAKGTVPLGHKAGSNLHIKIAIAGSDFKAYINEELKTTLKTTEFPRGKIGLYLYSQPNQNWDNISVYTEEGTSSTPPLLPSSPTSGATTPPGSGGSLFQEDFNDGLAQGFGNESGGWKVIDGKYTATTGQFRFSTAGDLNWQNYVLEADYQNAQDGGLLVRAQDSNNCISLVIRPTYNDIGWNIRKNGSWGSGQGTVTLNYKPGANLHIKIEVSGSELKAYINAELKTTLKTSEFPKGKIGLYLYSQADQYWDNVVVNASTPTSTISPTISMGTAGKLIFESATGKTGTKVQIPIMLSNLRDSVGNMDITLTYDPAVLKANQISKGALTSAANFDSNILNGTIRLAFFHSQGIKGEGSIAVVEFEVVGREGVTSSLIINEAIVNRASDGASLGFSLQNGKFTVSPALKGDCDGDGKITLADASQVLQMAVGKRSVDMKMDLNADGLVSSVDARYILRAALGLEVLK